MCGWIRRATTLSLHLQKHIPWLPCHRTSQAELRGSLYTQLDKVKTWEKKKSSLCLQFEFLCSAWNTVKSFPALKKTLKPLLPGGTAPWSVWNIVLQESYCSLSALQGRPQSFTCLPLDGGPLRSQGLLSLLDTGLT
jgi:hypothetical protein